MPLSMTPGSSIIASPELRCRHGLRRDLSSSALPILPAIRFTRGKYFGASRFTHLLRPAKLAPPLCESDRPARPSGAFTSSLPTDRFPAPLLDMTTTATGLLCWRDSPPLEWQLASLHQILTRLEADIFPQIGRRPIADIDAPDLLETLRKIEKRGALETARRLRQTCGQVFRYAIVAGRAEQDPSGDLRGGRGSPGRKRGHKAMARDELPNFLSALEVYDGDPRTGIA